MKSKNVPELSGTTGIKGMAKDEKSTTPPSMIDAPKALVPIMQAFLVESPKLAKSMVLEAARAIYGKKSIFGKEVPISRSELDGIVSLIRSIKPKDSLESLFAAQIIVGHMLGMRKLSENCADDQRLGLNLLRFSNEAMQMLIKKQAGATQNIVVNYSYTGQGNALMQTVLPNVGNECRS